MGTIEKLFVQIFDRKKWIEDQVQRQTLLFDHQLASKCLIDGIAPPPWLFSSPPNDLNKEELISGLLLPLPPLAVPYSGNCCSLYNKPDVPADKGDLPASSFTEVHTLSKGFDALSKGFDAEDRLSVSPQLPVNAVEGASNGIQKGDSDDVIPLLDQRFEKLSNASPEPAQLLENFQRSKSRQRALALRNSAKLFGSNLRDENNAGVLDGGTRASEIATLQHDHVRELELVESVHISKESCEVDEANLSEFHGKENESCMEELISPLILGPQPMTSLSSYRSVPFNKPAVTTENEELADVSNKELRASNKGLVAEDGLSNLHQFTVNDAACVSNGVLKMDFGAASPQDQISSGISDIDPKPLQSLARVQRSKSRQRVLEARDSAKAEKIYLSLENDFCVTSNLLPVSGIASLEFDQIGKSELVQTADFDNESCEVEGAKVHDFESKEKSSRIYRGKITISKKSIQPPSSMRKSSHADSLSSAGKSSRDQNNACCLESSEQQTKDFDSFGSGLVNSSNQLKQRKVGGRQNYAVSAAPSLREDDVVQLNEDRRPVDKMDHVDQIVSEGSKSSPVGISHLPPNQIHESELVETADFDNESCEVEGAKAYDFHSSNISSGRITRSRDSVQQPCSMGESSHAGTLAYAGRSSTADNNVGCPESSEHRIEENYASFGRGFGSDTVDSLAELKQRKVGGKLFDAVSPAPSFREDDLIQSNENRSPVDEMYHVDQLVIVTDGSKSSPAGISPLQTGQFHPPELVKTSNFDSESCEEEGAKVYDFQGKEKSSNIYSVRIMRSRSSDRQPSSTREFSQAGSLVYDGISGRNDNYVGCSKSSEHLIEENSVSLGRGGSYLLGSSSQFKRRKVGDRQNDAISAGPSWGEDFVLQSNEDRSPVGKLDHVEEIMTEGFRSSTVGISSLQPDKIHESELVKTADFDNESCEAEGAKLYDFQSKEKSSSIYSGRIRRSQSSVQQHSAMRESSHAGSLAYSGRSSRTDKNVGFPESIEQKIEENPTSLERGLGSSMVGSLPQLKQRKVGSRTNAVSAAPSLMEDDVVQSNEDRSAPVKKDYLEKVVTGGSKLSPVGISSLQPDPVYELEYSKPADAHCESCVVKEATVGDTRSEENSSIAGSTGITRSQTYSQQHNSTMDSFNKVNSFYTRTSNAEHKNVNSSESRQKSGKKSILPGNNFSCGAEDSWPQHKRRKVESHLNDSLSASTSLREQRVTQSGVNKSLVCEMDQNGDHKMKVEPQSSDKLQVDEDKSNSKERDRIARNTSFSFVQELEVPLISSFSNRGTNSKYYSVVEGAVSNTTRAILDPDKQCAMGGNEVLLHLDEKTEQGNTERLSFDERGMQEGKYHQGGNDRSSQCSVGPQRKLIDLTGSDQITPEFETFILETDNEHSGTAGEGINFNKLDLPKTTIERASVLEQLCKSACMNTPLSHFFTTYKLHQATNLYQSVPNRLLECIDLRNNPSVSDDIVNQLKASYSCFDEEPNHAYRGRSYSDCSPFSTNQPASNIRKTFGSPIGKFWDRITSNSASSGKRGSSNPELPCISEENENTDEVVDAFQEGISSEVASPVGELWDWTKSNSSSSEKRGSLNPDLPFITEEDENTDMVTGVHQGISLEVMPSSVKREPLADITENPNLTGSVPKAAAFAARSSLESAKTEFSFSRTIRAKQKHGHHISNKKNRRQAKMSHGTSSFGENGINRVSHNRFAKPKLSEKPTLRKAGPSFADRESKHNNIVSNVTSFIPLVQQKQAAAIITGKRDVKVKALEAAEAAKRLAEEKENERKMKKEALKLERAKLEQENLKQLELQKKKREEEKKKKEADMAARKRQREEEERKEKERKRKRVMESRKQQQENEEKLRAKKEEERKKKEADLLMDEQLNLTKVSKGETWRDYKRVKEQGEENLAKILKTESKATVVSTSDARETSIVLQVSERSTDCGVKPKATSHLEKATEKENDLVTNQNEEPSYDISPYKDSDNEEEEDDDDRLNTKFIPSWASKRASALVIPSLLRVSPEVIFPPGSFCSISEVLLPRRQQQNTRP